MPCIQGSGLLSENTMTDILNHEILRKTDATQTTVLECSVKIGYIENNLSQLFGKIDRLIEQNEIILSELEEIGKRSNNHE